MARIKIDLPEKIISVVNIPLRITDINYGNHLGNDALVGIIHEARVLWLHQMGYTEFDIEKKSISLWRQPDYFDFYWRNFICRI